MSEAMKNPPAEGGLSKNMKQEHLNDSDIISKNPPSVKNNRNLKALFDYWVFYCYSCKQGRHKTIDHLLKFLGLDGEK